MRDGADSGRGGAIADPTQQATCHAAGTILAGPVTTPFLHANICSTLRCGPVRPSAGRLVAQPSTLNDTGAREPEHTFHQPVPIVARIVWEHDCEEQIETVALGWSGQKA